MPIVEVIDSCPAGHHAAEDQPDAIGEAIARWLEQYQPSAEPGTDGRQRPHEPSR